MIFSVKFFFQNTLETVAVFLIALSVPIYAQQTAKIDHLTVAEDDLIHETQELDKRLEIFVKAIDRRLLVLNPVFTATTVNQENKKPKKKEVDKWGELPTGTRAELITDIKYILEEAVRNVDNAAEHNAKNPLLPKVLKTLADNCSRVTTQFKPFYDSANSEAEREAIHESLENCREIIEASLKHADNSVK